jgi:hypothetical protein
MTIQGTSLIAAARMRGHDMVIPYEIITYEIISHKKWLTTQKPGSTINTSVNIFYF